MNKSNGYKFSLKVWLMMWSLSIFSACGGGGGAGAPEVILDSISVTPDSMAIDVGSTQDFRATGHYSDGTSEDMTASVNWTSSMNSIATINNTGEASGVSAGTSTITASVGNVMGTALLSVNASPITRISVVPGNASIEHGDEQQFSATGHHTNGTTSDLTKAVQWESSNETVATVKAGLAMGEAVGTTTITARLGIGANALSGKAGLTVEARLDSITITPTDLRLRYNSATQLTATGFYSDGSSQVLTGNVNWLSSNTDIATVFNNGGGFHGVVNANDVGIATITADLGSVSASSEISVIGVISLRKTGQTNCYNENGANINCTGSGQDGEHQAGVNTTFRWGFAEFVQGCLEDNLSGLNWSVDADRVGIGVTWQEALDFVALLNIGGLCGHSDWRLPNRRELLSLFNFDEPDAAAWLAGIGFTRISNDEYWTSSNDNINRDEAYRVDMVTGLSVPRPKSWAGRVWLVRGGR